MPGAKPPSFFHAFPPKKNVKSTTTGMHKTQNTKQNKKKNKTNKTYYTEPGKCGIYCVFLFPPAAVVGGNMSAVAALMLARGTQRIEAQGTHEGRGSCRLMLDTAHSLSTA